MALQLPNLKQIYAARDCLKDVLIHDQQLVASIEKIEYAGQLERFGELHYIFKFREPGGPWLVGVSGGYKDKDQIEPGDYVGSMGDAFNEATMKGSAIALLDDMKSFMEGEDAKAIQEAFEDNDVKNMISHVKEVAAQAGLEISEEEIKTRLAEALGRMEGRTDEEREEISHAASFLSRYGDERFYPRRYSQTIFLDEPALYGKEILSEMKKRGYPVTLASEIGDRFECRLRDCRFSVSLHRSVETPTVDLRLAASVNYAKPGIGNLIPRAKAELVVTLETYPLSPWDCVPAFAAGMEAVLSALGGHALFIYTGAVVSDPAMYLETQIAARKNWQIPLLNFLWDHAIPTHDRNRFALEIKGLRAFGVPDIVFADAVPAEAGEEAVNNALMIAGQFLDRHWYPDYEERVMGDGGRQYFAYPENAKDGGPGTVTLRLTDEILMDDDDVIRDNLRGAGVKASQFSRMNRAGFFIRWAEAKGFLSEQIKKELAAYDGPNGLRGYLYYDWDGAPDAGMFVPELRPFVAEYYNINLFARKSYFTDMEKYAAEKLAGTKREADAKEIPEESHALLRWGDKTAEEIGAIIEKRYKAWVRKNKK